MQQSQWWSTRPDFWTVAGNRGVIPVNEILFADVLIVMVLDYYVERTFGGL